MHARRPATTCANCKIIKSSTLKPCAKCKNSPATEYYCRRECQKAHWKIHKKICGNPPMELPVLDGRPWNPFGLLEQRCWLRWPGRTERDVFRLLIDSHCFRTEELLRMRIIGRVERDVPDEAQMTEAFRHYLGKAEEGKLLPDWWTPEKANECVQYALDNKGWHSLRKESRAHLYNQYYADRDMGQQLHKFAEQVYGPGPCGPFEHQLCFDRQAQRMALGGYDGTEAEGDDGDMAPEEGVTKTSSMGDVD
ncbi:hypothetical protein ABW21_db0205225 [Orbilia brochopaga]|nr:hypothetical protein ABW21_db0205225 [Drechslerella brochopaga]